MEFLKYTLKTQCKQAWAVIAYSHEPNACLYCPSKEVKTMAMSFEEALALLKQELANERRLAGARSKEGAIALPPKPGQTLTFSHLPDVHFVTKDEDVAQSAGIPAAVKAEDRLMYACVMAHLTLLLEYPDGKIPENVIQSLRNSGLSEEQTNLIIIGVPNISGIKTGIGIRAIAIDSTLQVFALASGDTPAATQLNKFARAYLLAHKNATGERVSAVHNKQLDMARDLFIRVARSLASMSKPITPR